MNYKSIFLFILIPLFFRPTISMAACTYTDVCTSFTTCTSCAETCNRCESVYRQDPEYPKTVTNLPFDFNYSKADEITSNDTCSSTACGTKNCNAGKTTYSTDRIATRNGACRLSPNDRIPSQLNCRYRDGRCRTYCSRTTTYSCCASWTTVEDCESPTAG